MFDPSLSIYQDESTRGSNTHGYALVAVLWLLGLSRLSTFVYLVVRHFSRPFKRGVSKWRQVAFWFNSRSYRNAPYLYSDMSVRPTSMTWKVDRLLGRISWSGTTAACCRVLWNYLNLWLRLDRAARWLQAARILLRL